MTPLTGHLRELRHDQQLRRDHTAARIGVAPTTITTWDNGSRSPRFPNALTYAAAVGHTIVLLDAGGQVLAEGEHIPVRLPHLRSAAKVSQHDMGQRLSVTRSAVAHFDRLQHQPALQSVERYAGALGLRLGLAALPEAVKG